MPDEVLTIKEVAALLKLAEKTIYAMTNAGELPAFIPPLRGLTPVTQERVDPKSDRLLATPLCPSPSPG